MKLKNLKMKTWSKMIRFKDYKTKMWSKNTRLSNKVNKLKNCYYNKTSDKSFRILFFRTWGLPKEIWSAQVNFWKSPKISILTWPVLCEFSTKNQNLKSIQEISQGSTNLYSFSSLPQRIAELSFSQYRHFDDLR